MNNNLWSKSIPAININIVVIIAITVMSIAKLINLIPLLTGVIMKFFVVQIRRFYLISEI